MRPRFPKTSFIEVMFVFLLMLVLLGCSSEPSPQNTPNGNTSSPQPPTGSSPQASPSPVAKVGPYRIFFDDVLKVSAEKEKVARSIHPATPVTTIKRNIRKAYLDEMITRRLLVLGALQHPEWVTDASCEREVQRQLTTLGPDEVERRRKLAGVSKDDFMGQFRRFIREELMKREILRHEIETPAVVTDEEVRQHYDKVREKSFHRPDSWAVYHIDHLLPREKVAELPSVRGKLEELRVQASRLIESATTPQAKADLFSRMVQEHSHAPDAKTGYAYIYDTPGIEFDPEFVKRVKTATLGELSPVFDLAGDEKNAGACFFLVFEKKDGVYTPFERADRLIRADLTREKMESLRKALLERLRNEYKVEIWEDLLYQGIDTTTGG